ncbi:kinesin motor domain-containing protein [Encephalitozoon hellem ATCC 50504]|uniref:Kinesin-like protein n=1 Tax=Encephalitozoon hellem TaxID=27973 RepID=A0A9Q9C5U9_ENCHE|nr:kinesin motor domain-containing protein [Encephalitozoon hellem ATCC 50504]AFM99307.1 kinesin motor domain-containing protein [Encephalitozoon hellem ATCC 50504]UTX44310.1 kinesin-like protein [Encephalitozoon hellem]|eukprot:XP_003888288.1 kinesin motor domain-containing protein [Encephalitozoon hellem ATCC 50504]
MKDLRTYLAESKVEHLYQLFERLGIDESQLLAKLKYSDLEKIGIENLIERRKVFDIINEINQDIYSEDIEMNENESFKDSLVSSPFGFKDNLKSESQSFLGSLAEKNGLLFGSGETISQRLSSCSMPRRNSFEKSLIGLDDLDAGYGKATLESCDTSLSISFDARETGIREEKIIVCVRKRPCGDPNLDIVGIEGKDVIVHEERLRVDLRPYVEHHKFRFDYSFDWDKKNIDVYRECVKDIVNHVAAGGLGTVLAYGQTGTGKTYTMLEKDIGMMYLAIKDLMAFKSYGTVMFCEIYMGQVYDLLDNGKRIHLREVNGVVHLSNSKEESFEGYSEVVSIIDRGMSLRKTGVTGANSKSSRSHAVILVNFSGKKVEKDGQKVHCGSIVFVDLAGSERGSDRRETGSDVKNEGAEINKSLLALKECIRGMEKDKKHLPFRQSKLTQILKNSFVGASRTCLIATISSTSENVEHTLNTLRYASRIKESVVPKEKRSRESPNSNRFTTRGRFSDVISKQELERRHVESSALGTSKAKDSLVNEIRRALVRIESKIPSLKTPEELENALNLCKEIEESLGCKETKY